MTNQSRRSHQQVRAPIVVVRRRRLRVGLVCSLLAMVSSLAVVTGVGPSVDAGAAGPTTPTTAKKSNKTTTTIAGPTIALAQFPVQGLCGFVDSYGANRSGGRSHEGVDIIAKKGLNIYAVNDGTLTKRYVDRVGQLAGNGWRLTTADGTYYFYAHMSAFADGLSVGSTVVAGQIIGYIGATGNAGTPHLHFEIHPQGGRPVNPTQSVIAVNGCKVTDWPAAAIALASTTTLAAPVPLTAATTTVPATTTTTTSTTTSTTTTAPSAPAVPGLSYDPALRWHFITPVAVLTASSASALQPNVAKKIKVAGVNGLSKTPAAVVVRISATSKQSASIVVHPCDAPVPAATSLTVEAGPMAIGYATVAVTEGQICATSTGTAQARVTVVAQLESAGVGALPVATHRVIDTRTTKRLAANQLVTLTPEMLGASADSQALTATFTVIDPASAGTLLITPCGGSEVKAPFVASRMTSFSMVVRMNSTGLCLKPTVATNVLVDVTTVWRQDAPGLFPITAIRRFDSRTSNVPLGATPTPVVLGPLAGAPANVTAAQVSLTLIGGANGASVFMWPCAQPRPEGSIAVVTPNRQATFSIVTNIADGGFCLASNAPVHVLADIVAVG
ncbi:MAG: peptidoglycan DD-metalloendopeptidase family protein [Actinobacteria bacterium]|nr:peptidoglycan DD-metalloendopeptidase family protein [Actinomycetota bacterium]